ncbi:Dynein assembly factor 5, axonemal [Anabarilius grahami]|uniref:Dynein assembly factor 5, axonemal n=1 Tax=Anabarilius grahami TaxID=495550 RepID=A0A3N0Z3F3_ANAGA|nr:Dynein assembly factor 5, axonemal [Anabarilius grahami]
MWITRGPDVGRIWPDTMLLSGSLAEDLWKQVGSQWEKENEDDLKDEMDFLLSAPALYTSGGERPGLGCRELVVRNLSKLPPALVRDIGDWLVQTRVKTAQLLRVLLLHAEDHCTQHLQSLLTVLYHACADSEPEQSSWEHLSAQRSTSSCCYLTLKTPLPARSSHGSGGHIKREFERGPVVGEFLPTLLPLLKSCVEPSRDPEMKLHIFTMLSKLLLDASNTLDSQGRFGEYMKMVLQDLLLPNLVLSLEETLRTQLISALEEDSILARLLACRSLHSLLKLTTQQLSPDSLNKIYPELLKRVDDSSEDVRLEALKSLSTWFSSLGRNYDPHPCRPHLEFLFQQLLLYMDDPDTKVQDSVLEVLKVASAVDRGLLQQQTEAVREKQHSPEYCDKLLQHIHSL